MDLIPHRGFGQVLLGITEDKAIALLGEPDARASDSPDIPGGECHSWVYERLGVELSFDQDVDYRLARIRIINPNAVLNGHKPIGLPELEVTRLCPNARPEWSCDGLTDYVDSRSDVSLMVDGGKIVSVVLSLKYDESGNNPQWPEAR